MAKPTKPSLLPALPDVPAKGEQPGQALERWLNEAHRLSQQGDSAATSALIDVYRKRPDLLDRLSALAHAAEFAWLDTLSPANDGRAALTRQVMEREVSRLKDDLAGGADDPLERLLVARIAVAWLAVQYADKRLAEGLATDGMPWTQIEYRARHAERMGRHFLRATEALARVRRLLRPAQINIGQNQINVAG